MLLESFKIKIVHKKRPESATVILEPCHEKKHVFSHMRKQRRRSVTAQLISAFVGRYIDSTIFYLLLNPKFKASNYLLWMYSSVCIGPSRKP